MIRRVNKELHMTVDMLLPLLSSNQLPTAPRSTRLNLFPHSIHAYCYSQLSGKRWRNPTHLLRRAGDALALHEGYTKGQWPLAFKLYPKEIFD